MKKALKCIAFVLVLSMVTSCVYKILSWKDTTDDYVSSAEMLYNTEKNLIDAVFLGSSHTYCSIYPAVMWEKYGISAFDMAVSGQDKHSTYHDLKEVLKSQSPQVVVTDLYGLLFDRNQDEGNVYRNMLSLKTSPNSIGKVMDYIGEPEQENNYIQIPTDPMTYILRWPIVHTRYSELKMYDFLDNPINKYGRGALYSWYITPDIEVPANSSVTELCELTADDKDWIDKMAALAAKNGFTLIFYHAPYTLSAEEQKTLNAVTKYAFETYDIETYDINKIYKEMDFDFAHDMNDAGHSNGYGAQKISSWFGEMLSTRYGLDNHTGDTRYYQWDKDHTYYEHTILTSALYGNIDIYSYIKKAMSNSDYVVFVSLNGDFYNISQELPRVELYDEMTFLGGTFVYQNESWSQLTKNKEGAYATFDATDYDRFIFQYNPDDPEASMLFGNQSLIGTSDGISVAVYDNFTKQLVGTRYLDN